MVNLAANAVTTLSEQDLTTRPLNVFWSIHTLETLPVELRMRGIVQTNDTDYNSSMPRLQQQPLQKERKKMFL